MKLWKDDEVKNLFKEVEDCKEKNKSLKIAFENHAKKFRRKPNSVRNYYYSEVDNLKDDQTRLSRLGVNLDKHTKNHFVVFGKEESKLLEEIDCLTKQGLSVRAACQKLSGGDLALMTRLQNKYQNEKKKSSGNIIEFKQPQRTLTDGEINSLFLGLVKLIKRTAADEMAESIKQEKEASSKLLKQAFADLGRKTRELLRLQEEFENLKKENQRLSAKISDKNQVLRDRLGRRPLKSTLEN